MSMSMSTEPSCPGFDNNRVSQATHDGALPCPNPENGRVLASADLGCYSKHRLRVAWCLQLAECVDTFANE